MFLLFAGYLTKYYGNKLCNLFIENNFGNSKIICYLKEKNGDCHLSFFKKIWREVVPYARDNLYVSSSMERNKISRLRTNEQNVLKQTKRVIVAVYWDKYSVGNVLCMSDSNQ